MTKVMRSPLHGKRVPSLRRPSFAGRSLAERMRSTTFALFGLAAAAGLALVAIFAQPGGSLLSPAPLPSEPMSSVGRAQAVAAAAPRLAGHPVALRGSAPGSSPSGAQGTQAGAVGGGSGSALPTGTIGAPQSVGPSPAGEGKGKGGGNGSGKPDAPAPQPVPAPAPEPAPASESAPVSSPAPENAPTVHVSLPGHSAGGHPGGKEIAATVHAIVSPPPQSPSPPPVTIPPVVSPPPASPGDNGNGHGHGHDK